MKHGTLVLSVVVCSLLVVVFGRGRAAEPDQAVQPKLTRSDIDGMMKTLSNWGRWGKEDQLGTLNLITADKRKEAATLVQEGVSVSLAHNVIKTESAAAP
ncbi:MAG: hypothetical protein EXS05_19200 [Planctomycetaceae bacterium]|nr:hypothetical protein [Planctomycetaceae bacterium]